MRANKIAFEMQLTPIILWFVVISDGVPIYVRPPKTECIVCVTENHSYQTPNIKGDKGDAGQKVSFAVHINLIFSIVIITNRSGEHCEGCVSAPGSIMDH